MQLVTLLPIKVLVAMALAHSVRWSFQTWRDHRLLDQIEPILGQTILDDLKMASAVVIAAAVMIPAILAYAFVAWLIRSLSRTPALGKSRVRLADTRHPHVFD